jgi:3-hydroxy acid dehydrogenase / malonic semialdehyde reductase
MVWPMGSPVERRAAVTGASSGIGLAVTRELVDRGYHVVALALADERLEVLTGSEAITPVGLDVRDTEALAGALRAAEIDVLVSNAGMIGAMVPTQDYDPTTADALVDVNFRSTIHATLAVLPGMIARGRGHIVFTGSIAATRPTMNTAVYSATKAAVHAFADGLRLDLHGTPVRVTVLAPGRVETNLYDESLGGHAAAAERLYTGIESLAPADVASLVGLVVSLPAHVDVTRLEVIPTSQVYGGSSILPTK